ncbi:MAG: hypothetical protein ACXWBH_05170 [Candidatus Angelobacter sp.]
MAALEQELESLHELELEGEFEGEGELESELEGEGEFEGVSELEMEGEGEFEVSPIRKIYADAMMEHLGHMAAEAETEQEAAEHFLPLVGLAAKKLLPVVARAAAPALRKALPQMARAVTGVEPQLTRGITTIARGLHRVPATRNLLHAVPSIARRTIHSVARQAALGRPISARTAVNTLARQARKVLGQRTHRLRALRRSNLMDRRFHRQMGPGVVGPHRRAWRYGGVPTGAGYAPPRAATGWTGAAWPGTAYGGARPAVCPPCGQAGAAPAYCSCCGQLLR